MFGIGFPELVVIFVVALIVLGPERLPELARGAARWVIELRKAADELKRELGADELEKGRDEVRKVKEALLREVYVPPSPEETKRTPPKEKPRETGSAAEPSEAKSKEKKASQDGKA